MSEYPQGLYPLQGRAGVALLWACAAIGAVASTEVAADDASLNGVWQAGVGRHYDRIVVVPGISFDPSEMADDVIWYKRRVRLPDGDWNHAVLRLGGARFSPAVYVNGELVSQTEGGMAPTFHPLSHEDVMPGNQVDIEIALKSLADVSQLDASYIPTADQWRSNVSSGLWDDVSLDLYRDVRITRIVPYPDTVNRRVNVRYRLGAPGDRLTLSGRATARLYDRNGGLVSTATHRFEGPENSLLLELPRDVEPWTPEQPRLYRLELEIQGDEGAADNVTTAFGLRSFEVRDKRFFLNDAPYRVRAGTVVWPRWVRDPEGRELAYDTQWFARNVVERLKSHGANTLRFHLGTPPERLLDLCDELGLLVQYEWSFFHGLPASADSLEEQWSAWLDLAMRHPSVVLIHPYNETSEDQLDTAWGVLDELLKDYPSLVVEDRDVIHIHKYWWSLFENLGLYYDSADQFPKAIMVDEFGGNYLDGEANPGGYPTVDEAFLRFLGPDHSREERLELQNLANARVAEYWRRIGAAGFSPFTILGSREDGNHWFLGSLAEGRPKPVWKALTAAWSPRSLSLELWDRNFRPGQSLSLPLYLHNDLAGDAELAVQIAVRELGGETVLSRTIEYEVSGHSTRRVTVDLRLPFTAGDYVLEATLMDPPAGVVHPVRSSWRIAALLAEVPNELRALQFAVPDDEPELADFLERSGLTRVPVSDVDRDIVLTSRRTWNRIENGENSILGALTDAIEAGVDVVMLDVGIQYLGQGYPNEPTDLGPLQGVARIAVPDDLQVPLPGGAQVRFIQHPEPESHIHPRAAGTALWQGLDKRQTWLWNGLRGGLIVPAATMEFPGQEAETFLRLWLSRGADEAAVRERQQFAYVLEGFYGFSEEPDDREAIAQLRSEVRFIADDAPALTIDPDAEIEMIDLGGEYRRLQVSGSATVVPLAAAGKNLDRSPMVALRFGNGKGRLIVSQLLTAGRLADGYGEPGLYGRRYDEAAVQFVANLLEWVRKDAELPIAPSNPHRRPERAR